MNMFLKAFGAIQLCAVILLGTGVATSQIHPLTDTSLKEAGASAVVMLVLNIIPAILGALAYTVTRSQWTPLCAVMFFVGGWLAGYLTLFGVFGGFMIYLLTAILLGVKDVPELPKPAS